MLLIVKLNFGKMFGLWFYPNVIYHDHKSFSDLYIRSPFEGAGILLSVSLVRFGETNFVSTSRILGVVLPGCEDRVV